jgi:hypothetical protein
MKKSHGPIAFSGRTQRKILADLRRRALAGNVKCAEVLLRLGMEAGKSAATNLANQADG